MATDEERALAADIVDYVTSHGTATTQEQIIARMRELKAESDAHGVTATQYLAMIKAEEAR